MSWRVFKYWLPIAVVSTFFSGLVYGAVQQDMRLSANDGPIQLAEDLSLRLANGTPPQSLIPSSKIDMAKSLALFLVFYDESGQPITSSAFLDGQIPKIPLGVLDFTKEHGENRFTWQPKSGVRLAAVTVYYSGKQSGFILAARSLREVEKHEDWLLKEVFGGWIATLVSTFMVIAFLEFYNLASLTDRFKKKLLRKRIYEK